MTDERPPAGVPLRTSTIYVTSGSSALAPRYVGEVVEPDDVEYEDERYADDSFDDAVEAPAVDAPRFHAPTQRSRRTTAERAAADERAARRVADRAAGRVDTQERRRLRVAPPLPVKVARAPFIAMLCVLVVAGVIGILVLTARINANQFRLNNLQSQQAGLNQQEQSLQQTLAAQEAPGNLVAAAKKLGLVPAGTLAYITLPNGKVYGLPQPASSTPSITAQSGAAVAPQASASTPDSPGIAPSGAATTGPASTGATSPSTTTTGPGGAPGQ